MSQERLVHATVQVLPAALANQIAAGEVVQRPASVVKEAVENAVDAGARRVRVTLRGAGLEEIVVGDDGQGMGREDALRSLERHATSKIRVAQDLDDIRTLGFRGEALPSIAAVSRLRLRTCPAGQGSGTEIRVEGGTVAAVEEVAAPPGTELRVADLFYNVPARRKFLKNAATEQRNVVAVVTQQALVHFDVGFELRTETRALLTVPPDQSLEERVAEVVGAEAPGGLFWHRVEGDGLTLWFAFAAPHEGRGQRHGLRLFVNQRPVQDKLLVRAVLEGYRGLLESRRYPVALLWLQVPPQAVDVNVHPAKHEVRFRDEGQVFRRVAGAVAAALAGAPWLGAGPATGDPGEAAPWREPARSGVDYRDRVADALGAYARSGGEGSASQWLQERGGNRGLGGVGRVSAPQLRPQSLGLEPAPSRFGGLRYLGAFDATYLLFEDGGRRELVVLDQHAAHERILYEKLSGARDRSSPRSRALLLPVVLECSAEEWAGAEALAEVFAALGFEVERFGSASLKVASVPVGLEAGAVEPVVRDLLAAAELVEPGEDLARRLDAAAKRAACAAAVKARARLEPSEVAALLRDLEGLRNPTHCPHGRPLLCRLPRGEIEARFHRK
ncbi:MAG: DNA mismatch repair endonuclease MutL [Deferrisomatales bacterium]|nr:DNA mismatch repair endonuclease MutL [Deferrisomatales bacterium]